jgi:2-polyprenyl-6-methoxyphenol hydroxylase-like FAD-dependent oxidoreductase
VSNQTDVLIAGAGPNGLMVACELGLAGLRPVVLDSLPGPSREPRANGMVGQGVRILDHRGLFETLTGTAERSRPATRWMFAAFPLDAIPDSQVYFLPVPQLKLTETLAARAATLGADLRWGHSLSTFTQQADRVTATVSGPDGPYELTAAYLVGADGGHSTTRKLAGIDFPGMTSHDMVSRLGYGLVPPDGWIDPVSGVLEIPGFGPVPALDFVRTERGLFAWGPLSGRVIVAGVEWDSALDDERQRDTMAASEMTISELQTSIDRVLGTALPLQPAASDGQPVLRRIPGFNSRIAARYRVGRVLLVGDAAHVHSAMGGPGLNLGLQDAVNLGWKLAAVVTGAVGPALLDTYEAERRPVGERVIMHSRAQIALVRPGAEVTAMRALFGELLSRPEIVRWLSDTVSGADTRYPSQPDAHPLVGRWVPDLTIENASGPIRIAELTHDGRPLLLDLTEGGELAAISETVADWVTVVAGRALETVTATAVLVRPDCYVAWASSAPTPDIAELKHTLQRWFGIAAGDENNTPTSRAGHSRR